ncbi:intermembrane transport protein PqiB [Methylophaga muralis]|uniref:Paraquat-inducible protein B n=1 Tax=Methylophaga muralis TaxID=291169 RepID=A0A1E3GU47_9GAMM|nr:intermembrane transport protein PqiB [Methylophaga muralis]ODN67096.1 Paraquat-inducible protein B [Methylophaga muralis]
MSDEPITAEEKVVDPHRAKSGKQSRFSPIWIVPIVALLIGLWLIYDNYTRIGPRITLTMANAEGIEAGKTMIKTRNVDIGQVEQVRLSDDLTHTLIIARINPEAEPMLVEDSRFWVVKPRIGREGISGLNTVLSGAYIQLQPGESNIEEREFMVLEQPPISTLGIQGLRIKLISQLGNSLRVGDPVTYQGFNVGRVESAEFDSERREMRHQLFIESPYDVLVTEGTRFWSASGVDLKLDSEGFKVNIASLEALLGGGVTFGVLEDLPVGSPAQADSVYTLYGDEESARQEAYTQYLEYVLLIEDTVRGLSKGAPVEFRGIRIGTVSSVPWKFTSPERNAQSGFAIPVLIRLEPQRLGGKEKVNIEEWEARFDRMLNAGLRATLKSGNLLTGSLFVDLNFQRDGTYEFVARTFEGHQVLPTSSTGLAQIELKVSNLLDKLNQLEVEPILTGMDRNLESSETMLKEIRDLTASIQTLVNASETQEIPANINQTLAEIRTTLQGLSPDSSAYQEMTGTLQRLEKLLRDIQPVARTLGEQPNALIFDRRNSSDPLPRAPTE